jgi:hypothetical protein
MQRRAIATAQEQCAALRPRETAVGEGQEQRIECGIGVRGHQDILGRVHRYCRFHHALTPA